MTRVENKIEINASVEMVYEYYTNPDNIQQAWPNDVVKESESTTGSNSEGSEMKVKGEYMGREEEVRLQVVEKTPNSRLVARQTQGPFQRLESIQEFQGDAKHTRVRHIIDYELPTSGKFANFVTGNQADDRFRSGMKQAAEAVKQNLEK